MKIRIDNRHKSQVNQVTKSRRVSDQNQYGCIVFKGSPAERFPETVSAGVTAAIGPVLRTNLTGL